MDEALDADEPNAALAALILSGESTHPASHLPPLTFSHRSPSPTISPPPLTFSHHPPLTFSHHPPLTFSHHLTRLLHRHLPSSGPSSGPATLDAPLTSALGTIPEEHTHDTHGEYGCAICCETREAGCFYGGEGVPTTCGCQPGVCFHCVRQNTLVRIRDRQAPTCVQCIQPLPTALVTSLLKGLCALCGQRPASSEFVSMRCGHDHRFCGSCANKCVVAPTPNLMTRGMPSSPHFPWCHVARPPHHTSLDATWQVRCRRAAR